MRDQQRTERCNVLGICSGLEGFQTDHIDHQRANGVEGTRPQATCHARAPQRLEYGNEEAVCRADWAGFDATFTGGVGPEEARGPARRAARAAAFAIRPMDGTLSAGSFPGPAHNGLSPGLGHSWFGPFQCLGSQRLVVLPQGCRMCRACRRRSARVPDASSGLPQQHEHLDAIGPDWGPLPPHSSIELSHVAFVVPFSSCGLSLSVAPDRPGGRCRGAGGT